jgi:SWI/SNF-related matrix-associated actin-dependent regulator 1 of chromatin subfamily A
MQLFPYQHDGAAFLARMPQALLADEMGLGKSAQVVRACDLVGAQQILVVCPGAVRVNWSREFTRFSPMDRPCHLLMTGKDRPAAGINVVSYDLLVNEKVRAALKATRWDVVVIDEAHFLKERAAKRTKALYGHAQHPGIIHSAARVWRLSGTPAPNNASELYTHLKTAGVVKQPYWDFVFEYCDGFDSDYGFKITGTKNVPRLRALLAQFMLRRKKDDVNLQLPPIVFHHVTVDRSDVELDPWFYENWRPLGEGLEGQRKFLSQLKNVDTTLKAALATVQNGHHHNFNDDIKLLESFSKSTSTLRRYIGLAKLPKVAEILHEDLKSGAIEKLVIFAIHAQVIEGMRERLREFRPVTLYGNTPQAKRQGHIDKFQQDKRCRVFIGQVVAAGTGITLTAAHEVAFVEADWVPANNAQAAMRCHRVGQTRKVRVRFFDCAGSVDEDVNRVLMSKTREIAKFMD